MRKLKNSLITVFGIHWEIWMGLIVGFALGASVFSILVLIPKGLENWLSAVGTLLAVIVSLYLANRPKKKGKLEVFDNKLDIYLKNIEGGSSRGICEIGCSCFVSNSGDQNILIKSVTCWAFGQTIDLLNTHTDEGVLLKSGEIKPLKLNKDISNVLFKGTSMFSVMEKQGLELRDYVIKQGLIIGVVDGRNEPFNFSSYNIHKKDDVKWMEAVSTDK